MTNSFMKNFFRSWSSSDDKTVITKTSPNRNSRRGRRGRGRRGRRHLEENTTEVDLYPYPEFRSVGMIYYRAGTIATRIRE